jgi:hypothetical protein
MTWQKRSAALLKEKFGKRAFSTEDAYETLKTHSRVKGGYSRGSIHHLLSELCRDNTLIRLGRGLYSFPSNPHVVQVTTADNFDISDKLVVQLLPGKLAEAAEMLRAEGIEFMMTGPSALAKFHHYVARRLIHLIYVIRGSGELAVNALRRKGFRVLLNPMRRDIELALDSFPEADIFIVREYSDLEGNIDGRAILERALVDSYFETTRRRIPYPEEEVARIFENALRTEPISLTRLTRFADARGIVPEMVTVFDALRFRTGKKGPLGQSSARYAARFLSHIKSETAE